MLLSVLLLGTGSNTHAQILNGLSFNLTHIQEDEIHQGFHELLHLLTHSEKGYKLDIGQALFLKEGIQPLQTFLDKIKEFYEAEIQNTKFQDPKEKQSLFSQTTYSLEVTFTGKRDDSFTKENIQRCYLRQSKSFLSLVKEGWNCSNSEKKHNF
uniref:Serpin domain-containing protein n=1 Tax=Laticauda laticaudata TaxID=8630 RepID=A0A8C5SP71_LATLA